MQNFTVSIRKGFEIMHNVLTLADMPPIICHKEQLVYMKMLCKEAVRMQNKAMSGRFLKLHMRLAEDDVVAEQMNVLKKYGKVENEISRDVIVPAEMPINSLHYVIQQAFGWSDSHLHHFLYPDEVFSKLTNENFIKWSKLCGVYFRFSLEEDDELFWDGDDPDDYSSTKAWFRSKYTAPYDYCVAAEDHVALQKTVREFIKQNPVISAPPSFEEFMSGRKDRHDVFLAAATVDDIGRTQMGELNALLERLAIGELIAKAPKSEYENEISTLLAEVERNFEAKSELFMCANDLVDQLECAKELCTSIRGISKSTEHMLFDGIDMCTDELLCQISKSSTPHVFPLCDRLIYEYDFGDGWRVEITCVEEYSIDDELDEQTKASVDYIMSKHRPVCVAADGLGVTDDMGGVFGYIEMLQQLHNNGSAEKDEIKQWLKEMGWTGRMVKPENIL